MGQRFAFAVATALMVAAFSTAQMATPPASPNAATWSELIDGLLALPAPPPDWEEQARKRNEGLPAAQRDWFEGEPPEDAAPDVLLGYWADHAWPETGGPASVSRSVGLRLLEACEEQPGGLANVVDLLPDEPAVHERVERILTALKRAGKDDEWWCEDVRAWLITYSDRFRPQLIAAAQAAKDGGYWVTGYCALHTLAIKDWATAEPILRKHLTGDQPHVAAISLGVLYAHAGQVEDRAAQSAFREQLKQIVADHSAVEDARDEACDALMAEQWPGRDEWFLSLFSESALGAVTDRTLISALEAVVWDAPDYWIPRIVPFVGGKDVAAHNAAVSCLVQLNDGGASAETLRPLLPWLTNPAWAADRCGQGRLGLIHSLDEVDLPECKEGLLWVAGHDTGSALAGAADALAHYGVKEAVPILRAAVARETEQSHRRDILAALASLGGLSVEESASAVEAYARAVSTDEGWERVKQALRSSDDAAPLEPELSMGRYLAVDWETPSEAVAERLVSRVAELHAANPAVSRSLWLAIRAWPAAPVDREVVRRIAAGTADPATVRTALDRRASLAGNTREALEKLCEQGGAPAGIAACLLPDAVRREQILAGSDSVAQQALLACARLARVALPLPRVGELLSLANDRVATAAESYLESEDSPAARQLVLSHHPGEARILGAWQAFNGGYSVRESVRGWERELQKTVCADDGPDEVIALVGVSNWGYWGQYVITVSGQEVELRHDRGEEEVQVRRLTEEEWRDLRAFLSDNSIDDLAPLTLQVIDGLECDYIHLTRAGGRRVFMISPDSAGGTLYDRLVRRFERLEQPPTATPNE
ncbi:MAG: hypothetical protein PVJ57_16860 [Phycisphaerae bacterium]|jgi:hypothetical protein